MVYRGSLIFRIDWKCFRSCSCSCSISAAAAALFSYIRLKRAANWIILEIVHLLSQNLVHKGSLTFWIDTKGCCCCSCKITAAAAALYPSIRLEKAANWMVWKIIHLLSPNLLQMGSLAIWIDLKGCCYCSCSTAAAAAGLFLDKRLIKAANWVVHLLSPTWYKKVVWHFELIQKGAAAAVTILQLQQQHPLELIQIVKLYILSLVITNELRHELFNLLRFPALCPEAAAAAAIMQLQQQYCSCSCSTLLNQFRMSNYPCILSLVIINRVLL